MLALLGFIFWLIASSAFATDYNFENFLIGNSFSDFISSVSFKQINSSGQNIIGETNSTSFILKSGFLYYSEATSSPYALTVGKTGNGFGTVTSNPLGINCGSACSANFDGGAQVTLTAVSNTDSFFAGWSGGGCSGTGDCVIVLNASLSVTATFTIYSSGGGAGGGAGGGGSPPPAGGGGVTYMGGIGGIQVPCIPPKGDINRDCKVNLIDLSILTYWWERPLPPITVDMNKNGLIDMGDFSVLVFHWTG